MTLLAPAAFGDNTIVQLAIDGTSSSDVPVKAKADSLKDALNKGSLQVISQLIGPLKLEKNLPIIKSKILTQTSKFIQFYKAGDAITKNGETQTSVTMKISVSSIRDLLAQEGLLYQTEGPPTILPLFKVTEKKDSEKQFLWWVQEVAPDTQILRDAEKLVLHLLDTAFRPKNFYVIDPLSGYYVQWVPTPYRSENPPQDQVLWLGEFFKAQIVLTGDISAETSNATPDGIKLNVRLMAYHTSNGRIVGEVSRTFDGASKDWEQGVTNLIHKGCGDVAKDLSSQVVDESTRGTLGATLLRLTLRGNFNYQDLENFKKQVLIKMGDVKTIKERKQEKGLTTFELDYAGTAQMLVKTLETNSFDGFKIVVQDTDNNEVVVKWAKANN